MATFSRHQASISNVGSYQVSGYPYISGSVATKSGSDTDSTAEFHFVFPRVAKSVTVIFASGSAGDADSGGTSAGLRVHFHSTGAVGNSVGNITATNGIGKELCWQWVYDRSRYSLRYKTGIYNKTIGY